MPTVANRLTTLEQRLPHPGERRPCSACHQGWLFRPTAMADAPLVPCPACGQLPALALSSDVPGLQPEDLARADALMATLTASTGLARGHGEEGRHGTA